MSANKRLLKVAKYLGNQGLYEEAAQIKKLAMETIQDKGTKRIDNMRNSEIGKLLQKDINFPKCTENSRSWGIGIGQKGQHNGPFAWYPKDERTDGEYKIKFFKPIKTKNGEKMIISEGEEMSMTGQEVHKASTRWLKEGSKIEYEEYNE